MIGPPEVKGSKRILPVSGYRPQQVDHLIGRLVKV